jgi:hypothetical protein
MARTMVAPLIQATPDSNNLARRLKLEFHGRREATATLNEVGFTRTLDARYRALLLLLVLAVGFTAAVAGRASEAVVAGGVALGAVLLGAQQFAASRNEVSLDKFYDRLQENNDKLEAYRATREFIGLPFGHQDQGQFDDDDFQRRMYVFRELDNLEYSIAKYRIGFMSPENPQRSLRTFRSRCIASQAFGRLAHEQVRGVDDARDPGYDPQTKLVVCKIVQQQGYAECSHV